MNLLEIDGITNIDGQQLLQTNCIIGSGSGGLPDLKSSLLILGKLNLQGPFQAVLRSTDKIMSLKSWTRDLNADEMYGIHTAYAATIALLPSIAGELSQDHYNFLYVVSECTKDQETSSGRIAFLWDRLSENIKDFAVAYFPLLVSWEEPVVSILTIARGAPHRPLESLSDEFDYKKTLYSHELIDKILTFGLQDELFASIEPL